MSKFMKLRTLAFVAILSGIAIFTACKKSSDDSGSTPGPYVSPYKLDSLFTFTDLGADFAQRDLINPSTMDTTQWYNINNQYYIDNRREITWGPWPSDFGSEAGYPHNLRWQQQRIIYVAQRYIGSYFQYHHLLQFNPPSSWPWDTINKVSLGHNSKGIDASNFTRWLYNYGLGYHLDARLDSQYVQKEVNGYGEIPVISIVDIQKPASFDTLVKKLQIGDLIYCSQAQGSTQPYHVAIWIGKTKPSDNYYLVIDAYDGIIKDLNNANIPQGIRVRPIDANSYYFTCMLKARRVIQFNTMR